MDEIKSKFSEYGIARANKFKVTIKNVNKFLEPRYKYDGDDGVRIPERISFMCEMAELPTKQLNLTASRFRKMPSEQVFDNLAISFKVGKDGLERRIFDLWMAYIIDLYSDYVEYQVDYVTDIDIELLDPRTEETVYHIRLVDAYPMTVGALQLQATVGGDFMTQSVTFAYRFWDIVTPDEGRQTFNTRDDGLVNQAERTKDSKENIAFDLRSITSKVTKTLDTTKGLLSLNQGETLNLYNKVNGFFTKNTGLSINDARRWTEQTKRDIEAITDEDVLSNANKVVLVGGLANILGLLPKP